jgi:hypothetical protein
MIYFDIETCPADNADAFLPEIKPPGNIKKAETLAAWERDDKPKLIEQARADAALSPLTGRVLCIGTVRDDSDVVQFYEGPEDYLLGNFWADFTLERAKKTQWVGFNSTGFDWPFLVKRSWIVGVAPARIFDERGYLPDNLIDLRKVWQCGDRQSHGSLDVVCRLMGLGKKTGQGADFAKLYNDDATRNKALDYLGNDLLMTRALAQKIL